MARVAWAGNREFTQLYNDQHLSSNVIDPFARVTITTIQRLYSILKARGRARPRARRALGLRPPAGRARAGHVQPARPDRDLRRRPSSTSATALTRLCTPLRTGSRVLSLPPRRPRGSSGLCPSASNAPATHKPIPSARQTMPTASSTPSRLANSAPARRRRPSAVAKIPERRLWRLRSSCRWAPAS
jgi:hypothetical protein